MFVLVLLYYFLIKPIFVSGLYLQHDVDELTRIFFQNLKVDPILSGDLEFSEDSRAFVDRQVGKYLNLIAESEETEYSRSKRSLRENETTSENYFVDIKPLSKHIPTNSPADLVLFRQNSKWYAACLEKELNGSQKLSIKKMEGNITEVVSKSVSDGVAVAAFSLNTFTIITVAQNSSARQHSDIMKFNSKEELEVIQKINTSYSSHVEIWEQEKNIYMAVSQFMRERTPGTEPEVDSPIYKWQGRHFDVIQYIRTKGVRKISHFAIDGVQFLAVANSKSDYNRLEAYSEIMKYDVEEEKYKIFQKIVTYGCRDIELVEISVEGEKEYFLAVANTFEKDSNGQIQDGPSIIYKFVDDYFIPFQSLHIRGGVTQWLPVTVENGEVILFAATIFEGIKCFHYNGWHFVESQIESKNDATSGTIKAMHFYKYLDKNVVVITSDKENMFEVGFTAKNELKTLYNELLEWCTDKKKTIEKIEKSDILGQSTRGDVTISEPDSQEKDLNEDQIQSIQQELLELEEMESKLNNSLKTNNVTILNDDIKANEIIINNDALINSVQTESINKYEPDFFHNILDISKGFEMESLEFDSLKVENDISPETINSAPRDNILQNKELISIDNVIIDGSITFLSDLNVNGEINDVSIDRTSILLKNGDQSFGSFKTRNVEIDDLQTHLLNSMDLHSFEKATEEPRRIKELKAKNLKVIGYVNNVDIKTLEKYSLKINENQNITKNYYVDSIEANNFEGTTLGNKLVLEDFIIINNESYSYLLNKDVKFSEDIEVNNLKVLKYLDSIPIKKGRLDILQRYPLERQYISGIKSFENLELLNPIQLRGKIRSKVLDTMNPGVTIDTNLDLDGDIRITGDVIVEEIIKSNDVVTSDGVEALSRVRQQGLKLTDTEIPIRLNFAQHINVDGVFVARINNIDPRSWVVNGAKEDQIIRGWKRFRRDLEITGDTRVFRVNDIDIDELEKNVLRQSGEQVVRGKHYVKMVVADEGINSDNIKLGPHLWNNVITNRDQPAENATFSDLTCNMITAPNINISGLINGVNISKIFSDVVTRDTKLKIPSHKKLKSLTIENLNIKNDKDFIKCAELLQNRDIQITGDMEIEEDAAIENIHFSGKCNGVENDKFIINIGGNGSRTVYGNQEFDTIKVIGNVYVDSNIVSGINLTDFEDNTVKINEPFDFETVTFNEVIIDGIDLEGHVDRLDLDNIFQNNNENLQILGDEKIFEENVIVEGNAAVEGLLNSFNVSDICDFSTDTGYNNLIIEGDAYFAKGPHVIQLNKNEVQSLKNDIWFTDKYAEAKGYIQFENSVTFNDNVTVLGLVNGIHLNLIQSNYLSKSKNQTVSANLKFLDEVYFESDISTPRLHIDGEVNGLDINTFAHNILLDGAQLFKDIVYLETCIVTDVQGIYKVNNMSFETDVMRYDQTNIVSGHKKFKNLDIGNLKTNNKVMVNNVDILEWASKGLRRNQMSKITGSKILSNITLLKGMSLEGTLNGRRFDEDTVMLKNVPQNVTGRKMFIADAEEGVTFKALKIKGLMNDVDVAELAHNQVLRNKDNLFKSEINFYANITARNVFIKELYNGVNVTELLRNISTLAALNNFEEKYNNLLEMSHEIENSLLGQAYFLHYYKSVASIPHATKIFSRRNEEGGCQIMAMHHENGTALLKFFDWNGELSLFEDRTGYSIVLGPISNYVHQVTIGERDYIYIEHEVDPSQNSGYKFLGKLLHFKSTENRTEFDHHFIPTIGTIFLTSFEMELRNEYCLVLIDSEHELHIICINSVGEFYLLQQIKEKFFKASVINMDEVPYLVTIKRATTVHEEPRTSIWRFNNGSSVFELYQTIYEGDPISVTTVTYKCGHYVAVAYGHLQNTMQLGRVVIRRFDVQTEEFSLWQNIHLATPTHVEFSILPSEELVLYVLTENPTEPLIVYIYEGISGFSKKIVGSAIPSVMSMNQFSINNKHFVVTQHFNYVNIIQAIFKGEKLYEKENDEI